jgi:hypothetical protein
MKNQKAHNFAVVAVTAMLLATVATSMATSVDVFAYKKNQAASQANACGNGEIPTNVGCQNTGSQIQGDENAVSLAAQQTFPQEEIPPVPPVPPAEACRACLELLSDAQLQALATEIAAQFDIVFPANPTPDQIIDIICEALELGPPAGLVVGNVNAAMAQIASISVELRQEVSDCLRDIF